MVGWGVVLLERPVHSPRHTQENLPLCYLIKGTHIFLISFLAFHDVHSGLQSIYLWYVHQRYSQLWLVSDFVYILVVRWRYSFHVSHYEDVGSFHVHHRLLLRFLQNSFHEMRVRFASYVLAFPQESPRIDNYEILFSHDLFYILHYRTLKMQEQNQSRYHQIEPISSWCVHF